MLIMKKGIFDSRRSVIAGHNCKCQDPSGTGPQYDEITQYCCGNDVSTSCPPGQPIYHGDQHHQVSI